jgi:hypothetical protein
MLKVEDYRIHAAECRRLAAGAALPHLRDELTKMAEAWEALAEQRETILEHKLRPALFNRVTASAKAKP